ncbi:unnamed protein product [Sphagnum troendelagicum]|uniref:Uncharacterized protein n=1 Tax=Sphagnum troendelagicum TaxID=128251 RepID=A0ABP0V2K4_9BRYO
MPHDGGAVLPKDVQMTPLSCKGLINLILSDRVLNGLMRVNRLLGGHADFDSGNPGLMKDLSKIILIVKMFLASLGPKEIKDEVAEDVKGLPNVGEAPDVVSMEVRWVVLVLENNFTKHDEGLGKGDIVRRPPFLPNAFEGLSNVFGEGAFKKAMLGGFRDPSATYLAGNGDPNTLEPSSNG